MYKIRLEKAVDYFKDFSSRPLAEQLNDEEYIKNFAELILCVQQVIDGKIGEYASEEEISLIMNHNWDINLGKNRKERFEALAKFLSHKIPAPQKMMSEVDILNIIEEESKLDMDYHGRVAQKIAKALAGKIPVEKKRELYKLSRDEQCEKCGQNVCYCPERQADGSWKDIEKKFDNTSMDAVVWAKEFMRVYSQCLDKEKWIDEDLMRAWFANAIMVGYDNANWRRDKKLAHNLSREKLIKVIQNYRQELKPLSSSGADKFIEGLADVILGHIKKE